MKKMFLFLLLYFIIFSFSITYASDDYSMMLYDNGWKNLTKDVNVGMNEPVINTNIQKIFNLKMVHSGEQEVGRVSTPMEYFNSRKKGNFIYAYTTYDIIDKGLFEDIAMSYIYLSKAKPSKYSYVRGFPFDEKDPLTVLPVDFISWVGSDQREAIEQAIEQKKPWRSLAPNAKVLEAKEGRLSIYDTFGEDFYSLSEKERYSGDMPSHIISPSVLGDLNGDGYEDIVLSCAHYWVEGSGRSYYLVVLTRKSNNAIFEDITEEVDKIIWD